MNETRPYRLQLRKKGFNKYFGLNQQGWRNETVEVYTAQYLLYLYWLMEWNTWLIGCDWLMGCHTKCVTDSLTELQKAVNAWVAFAAKKKFIHCLHCWSFIKLFRKDIKLIISLFYFSYSNFTTFLSSSKDIRISNKVEGMTWGKLINNF